MFLPLASPGHYVALLAALAFVAGLLAGWWGKEAQQREALFWREGWRREHMSWFVIYMVLLVVAVVVGWVVLE